jgi:Carboxypeptidase regulatory-like domain/TonB dependent receptor
MKSISVLLCLSACLAMQPKFAFAQGVGASGTVTGTITDTSGAVITNAIVTAVDTQRGTKRAAVTDSIGRYEIAGLAPATYNITAQKDGFQTTIQKNVTVNVGQTVGLNFNLDISKATSTIEVTAETPLVETESGKQANTITSRYIQDLPINRRDYLTFTLLAPGVSDSTRLASDQDFRVKQTPQSGLSFYGSNGRGNSVTVDGGEANDDAGGVRLTMSQEGVQEFQINRSNYGADLGGASGASINIVSKTGTNDLHGSLFGLFRNDIMDARNPFALTQALQPGQVFNPLAPNAIGAKSKDSLSREQFGASIGFPIQKNKTFGFVAFEGLIQNAQNAVPLLTTTQIFHPDNGGPLVNGVLTGNNQQAIIQGLASKAGNPIVPCLSGPPVVSVPAATCAQILTTALTTSQFTGLTAGQAARNQYLVNQFENNGGLFNYDTNVYYISARFDHTFNEHNQGYFRYSFAHDREESPDVQSLVGFSAGSSVHAYDNTAQATWFHQFSSRTQNELSIQYNYSSFDVLPNVPGQVGLVIPGFANLGTNIFLPSTTILQRPSLLENATMIRGNHTMNFGGVFLYRGNRTESNTFFPGRFVFGDLPGGVLSPCLQTPATCGLNGVNSANINSLQSASLGAPQFYQQGFGNPLYNYPRPWGAVYWQDRWNIRPNLTLNYGLRYEIDAQYGPLSTDKDNFAPRASFAWSPLNNQKLVVRGGFGIFYSPIYGQIADVVQTLGFVNGQRQIAQVFVPLTGAPGNPSLTSAAIFQTLFAQGLVQCTVPNPGSAACITPANLTQFGINVTNVGPPPPLSVVFSGQPGYQSPYSEQASFAIESEVAKNLVVSVSYIYVHTLRLPVAIDTNALPAFSTLAPTANGQIVSLHNWNVSPLNPLGAPCAGAAIVQCFVNPLLLQTNQYSSVSSGVWQGGILEVTKRLSNHYSLLGNFTYSKGNDTTTDFNSDFGPQDNTELFAERGLSSFDQRYKVVAAAVAETTGQSLWRGGWQVAPIFRYNSGHPFNLLAGTDVNGDRHSTNDRPIGAGRNTGLGPDFIDLDLRLTKSFAVGERAQVLVLAEGFNLFNRANFASINNVVGPTCVECSVLNHTFVQNGLNNVIPSQGLGFTSALSPRQFQLGVRMTF